MNWFENNLNWIVVICFLILISNWIINYIRNHWMYPKYKVDEEGYVMFYYPYYNQWEYFPIWKDDEKERQVKVHDIIRNVNYNLSYIGSGRARLKLIFDDHSQITQDYITKYVRQLYPGIKNSEQLWQLHTLYVNKENILLNNIAKNKIFK